MVGKTVRAHKDGSIAPASNSLVEAESAEAAALLFVDHPHLKLFPGDGVDVMPFLSGPDRNWTA